MKVLTRFCFSILLYSLIAVAYRTVVFAEVLYVEDGVPFKVSFVLEDNRNCYLKARPVLAHGTVEIHNGYSGKWVSGNYLWTEMPNVCNGIVLRVKGVGENKNNLSLIIYNPEKGETLLTKYFEISDYKLNYSYIQKLNEFILLYEDKYSEKEHERELIIEHKTSESSPSFSDFTAGSRASVKDNNILPERDKNKLMLKNFFALVLGSFLGFTIKMIKYVSEKQ